MLIEKDKWTSGSGKTKPSYRSLPTSELSAPLATLVKSLLPVGMSSLASPLYSRLERIDPKLRICTVFVTTALTATNLVQCRRTSSSNCKQARSSSRVVIKRQHNSIFYLQMTLSSPPIDIAANRAATKYSTAEQVRRILWMLGRSLISLSPRPAFAWRRMVLRLFGARVGKHVNIYPSTRIYMPWNVELGDWSALGEETFLYSLGKIRLGNNVTVSYRAHLCAGTHDLNDPTLPLLKPSTLIDDGAWIGTDAFIGPGVRIGSMAVVGARAVVTKNVDELQIVVGNPAKPIGTRYSRPAQRLHKS